MHKCMSMKKFEKVLQFIITFNILVTSFGVRIVADDEEYIPEVNEEGVLVIGDSYEQEVITDDSNNDEVVIIEEDNNEPSEVNDNELESLEIEEDINNNETAVNETVNDNGNTDSVDTLLTDNTDDNTDINESVTNKYGFNSFEVNLKVNNRVSIIDLLKENINDFNEEEYRNQLIAVSSSNEEVLTISDDLYINVLSYSEQDVIIGLENSDNTMSQIIVRIDSEEIQEDNNNESEIDNDNQESFIDENTEVISDVAPSTEDINDDELPEIIEDGFDNGVEYDALYYPESPFNPYPGNIYNNCTYAVWYLVNNTLNLFLPGWGNAGSWYRRAALSGYSTGSEPRKNSILVSENHVVFVKDVLEDGRLYLQEGNIQGKYRESYWAPTDTRYGKAILGYIYLDEKIKTLETTDEKTYKVSVALTDSDIYDNVELQVTPIEEDSDEYERYLNNSAKKLNTEKNSFRIIKALDIKLIDTITGEQIEPEGQAKVSIELLENNTDINEEELNILHIHDYDESLLPDYLRVAIKSNPEILEDIKDKNIDIETLDYEISDNTIDFNTDGFSVFVVAQVVKEQILEASDGSTYSIKVSYGSEAGIPLDAQLNVEVIEDTYLDQEKEELGILSSNIKFTYAFDITIIDPNTNIEYEPDDNVKVSIELINEDLNDVEIGVLHIDDEDNSQLIENQLNEDNNTIEFETDGFSRYVVVGYTVDFHYGEYTYSIDGESEVYLSKILNQLGINILFEDIVSVSFSNDELIEIEEVEIEGQKDYLIKSLNPFDTEETLSLTLSNEKVIDIIVTDDPIKNDKGITVITITADSASKAYKEDDTTALTANGYSITSGELLEGHSISSVTITGSQTGLGSSDNVPTDAKIVDSEGADVTNQYKITYEKGTLSVYSFNKSLTSLDGSWAYWKIELNKDAFKINNGNSLVLKDTFTSNQSIDYSSVTVTNGITYDYSGNTGTFTISDSTAVEITYRTRVSAETPGTNVTFGNTAKLFSSSSSTESMAEVTTSETQVIYPSASDVAGFGDNYMVRMFVYGNGQMQTGIPNVTFILLDVDQCPLEYKLGDNKGQPVTFTTGSDGYVNIELHEEDGDVSIDKNTAYYLEMITVPDGYQKDNTLYSFMITDDPDYSSGGIYTYYNGDTMKVRLYSATAGLSVSLRFSGNYSLTNDQKNNVEVVLQKWDEENDNWVEVERHPYSDSKWGAISFSTTLDVSPYNNYRVIEENEKPWDLPSTVKITRSYYCMIGSNGSDQESEPKEFHVDSSDDPVNVVIDNRYEIPKLTIVKMDKDTGIKLPGAVFTVYKAKDNSVVKTYTTTQGSEYADIVISGDDEGFESETLYYVKETIAPSGYLLPLQEEKHYFYFCNDEYLIPTILEDLPEGYTATNLTDNAETLTIDNQKEYITIPVMKIWQGNTWPTGTNVTIGLYQSVNGATPTAVYDENGKPRVVVLSSSKPYSDDAFDNLPSRENNQTITYSIKEEKIGEQDPLVAGYVQEYGVSSAGVYVVRNKPATSLTVNKKWLDNNNVEITDETILNSQSSVTFDVYRTTGTFDADPSDGITNADMSSFVSSLTKVKENLTFSSTDGWTKTINDLDLQDDVGNKYHYYILETVPSYGTELYEIANDGTITIKNKVSPDTATLKVTKAALVNDPRPESVNTEFEFTLKLELNGHVIRQYSVNKDLTTDWNGEVTFKLKPEESIDLTLPQGVSATVTETANSQYTTIVTSEISGEKSNNNRTFTYTVTSENNIVTYTNTLRVICKVIADDGTVKPFESLSSALKELRNPSDEDSYTSPWTIQMLEDYEMPSTDVFNVQSGETIKLTTASITDSKFPYIPSTDGKTIATITRGANGSSLLSNAGTLTLENIILDGNKDNYTATSDGGLINSNGVLYLNNGTTLCNSASSGKGGAVYVVGTVDIVDGVNINNNEASSASALYLSGTLNMSGGNIENNTGASDGAVVITSFSDKINLSDSPVIFNNTGSNSNAANLYIGVDSDQAVRVVNNLSASAHIGVTAMEGHTEIGEQFAVANHEMTNNLARFINDKYGYRGKVKDGTSTNIVWDGLTIKVNKEFDSKSHGCNENDGFTITISSLAITRSSYTIDGTVEYTITAARNNRPGKIVLRNVKSSSDIITISPLPVGDYVVTESASNYNPTYIYRVDGSEDVTNNTGVFTIQEDGQLIFKNTRRSAAVNLTKSLQDVLSSTTVDFDFALKLVDSDGTTINNYPLTDSIKTNDSGVANVTMSPSNDDPVTINMIAPVGSTLSITESESANSEYRIKTSAKTIPTSGEGEAITDSDSAENVFAFVVSDDGADVKFANVRKMANITLTKKLVNKVSTSESFNMHVTLLNKNGTPAAGYTLNNEKSITTNNEGEATITFTFGNNDSTSGLEGDLSQDVVITIPEGSKLTIEEEKIKKTIGDVEVEIYDIQYKLNDGSAVDSNIFTKDSISESDNSILFTNTRKTQTVTVTNEVKGYSGNTTPFAFTATITEDGITASDYDNNGFTDGTKTFELATGQSEALIVPYGAKLNITEGFVIGYDTTVKHGNKPAETSISDEFDVTENTTVAFTNNQLINIRLVNNTSHDINNVVVYTEYGSKMYRVSDDGTSQVKVDMTNHEATINIEAGKTAILEVDHQNSVIYEQAYKVSGKLPADNYYYTINNEPSFHEFADPAILRVYDASDFEVKGKLRYSVSDSTITFSEQPLVSYDINGGVWISEMEDYHDKNGDHKVYQYAVNKGDNAPKPTTDMYSYATKENIELLGWTTDEEFAKSSHTDKDRDSDKLFYFETTTIDEPITLYAVWNIKQSDSYTITIQNGTTSEQTFTVTLKDANESAIANYTIYDDSDDSNDIVTNSNGTASFNLSVGTKNLTVPKDSNFNIIASDSILCYSSTFEDSDSVTNGFTINSVKNNGIIAFIIGICKITDENHNILYDGNGNPTVYPTLAEAFTEYNGELYTTNEHTVQATPAYVEMLVDEYAISSKHQLPTKDMTLITAGKNDQDFPYVGVKNTATLYRASTYKSDTLITLEGSPARDITFENIIFDGKEVPIDYAGGGFVWLESAGSTLNIHSGTIMRNVAFKYDNNNRGYGGAICAKAGTLNVNAGSFYNLTSRRGGAICAMNNASLNVSGSNGSTKFEKCYSQYEDGGAIYYSNTNKNASLTINGGQDNKPGIIFTDCKTNFKNTANSGNGGAIYAYTNYINNVMITGCAFTECSARTTNTASTYGYGGGAICALKVKTLSVSNCSFSSCDTLCGGGAIAAYVKTNESGITISDCSFDNCSCKSQGGALAVYQDDNGAKTSNTKLTIINSSFIDCSSGTNNSSGGAIQCYLPCMDFTNTSFADCWAGKEGGAVNHYFGSNYGDEWSNSSVKITDCEFYRCRAEDRYDTTALQHYGGGMNTKAKTVQVTGSYFEDCVSTLKEGGALHLGGQGSNSKSTINNSTFKNCSAKNGGGALLSSAQTLEINNSNFYGCSSFASNGGAVYHYRNNRSDSTQNTTTITNSTFSAVPGTEGEDKVGCNAAVNGGAIWTRANTVNITNSTISDSVAGGNGGAIYLSKNGSQSATISGGSITGNKGVKGSAVYADDKVTFSSVTITDNVCTNENSGAIHGTTLYFDGDTIVKNNIFSTDNSAHNVVLQNNNNTTINTTKNGLSGIAEIGVYVITGNPYNNHGIEGKPFGTFADENGYLYLDAFVNDRNENLYGYQSVTDESDKLIYWGTYVFKITDAKGNTLKRANGRDAIYPSLSVAFDDFISVNNSNNTSEPVYVKALVEDYLISQTGQIDNFPSAALILTTESYTDTTAVEGKYDGKYPYRGTEGTVCTISRTNSTNQLFKMNNSSTTFTLENITLDGRKDKTTSKGNYRLIEVADGTLVVSQGTTMQYGYVTGDRNTGGGAIFGGDKANIIIKGSYDSLSNSPTVKFIGCVVENNSNGGAIRAVNLSVYNSDESEKNKGIAFIDCKGIRGGAIYFKGSTIDISDILFDNCSGSNEGGAFYHDNNSNSTTTTISNCEFNNCYTNGNDHWSYGGAVTSKAETLIVNDCNFVSCYALSSGGAINHGAENNNRVKTEIVNTTFDNCKTTSTNASYGYGGTVYTQAKTVTLNNSSITNSIAYKDGGGLYCQSSDNSSNVTITDTSFENCSVTNGSGGAICSNSKTLTLNKKSTIANCKAKDFSGAVHMNTNDSNLTITDNVVISSCYAKMGGAIYLNSSIIMTISESPEFTNNGYTTQDGVVVESTDGACIYLVEGSILNISGSPKFSRNILPKRDRITNGGITDNVRQDIYIAGYSGKNATSINVVGELTGDVIWVWPERSPHRIASEQFAQTVSGVSDDSLSHLRNALSDNDTHLTDGEYLAGVRYGSDNLIYWDKMYVISFKKIDNKAVAVPGAEFTLYKDIECSTEVATDISADGETVTDAQGNLRNKGIVEFTSIQIGVYYMKETEVPESFRDNNVTYIVLVGTPNLSKNDDNIELWESGPLNVDNAEILVKRNTTDAGKYYGIFPLDQDNKAVLTANLASNTVGIENIRNDYQASFIKVDSSGNALPGASFTIYTQMYDSHGNAVVYEDGYPKIMRWSRDGENYPAPVKSADGTSTYRDIDNKTLDKGVVYFRELPLGTYYLLETEYPERDGNNRRTFYIESDRVFKLVLKLSETPEQDLIVEMYEWTGLGEDNKPEYRELTKDSKGYYVVDNKEAICKLTEGNTLLYTEGHVIYEDKNTPTTRLLPAIYTTVYEGLAAATSETNEYVDAGDNKIDLTNLKLQLFKDQTLDEAITYNSSRALTLTTASTTSTSSDKYVFSTTRTSDTKRVLIKKGFNGDLITISGSGAFTLQNINLNANSYTGRAAHALTGSALNISTDTMIQNFKAVIDAEETSINGGAVLLDSGSSLNINGGYNRTAIFTNNTITNTADDTISYGGAIAIGKDCNVVISNAQFVSNKVSGDGGAIGFYEEDSDGRKYNVAITNAVFRSNTASNNGGAVQMADNGEIVFSNSTFTSNSAALGSAVYGQNYADITISGGSINSNTASDTNGGAINVADINSRIYFGGNAVVNNNKTTSGIQKNVVLGFDSNEIINTTKSGLGTKAQIGIYVVDGTSLYNKHGVSGKPFGTFGDDDRANASGFVNDRNPDLYGVTAEEVKEYGAVEHGLIYWKLPDGSQTVILRKISNNYDSLSGARFNIYADPAASTPVRDQNGNELSGLTSNANGIFYVGDLSYGTYYVKETVAPSGYSLPASNYFFIVTVSEDGVGYKDGDDLQREVKAEAT